MMTLLTPPNNAVQFINEAARLVGGERQETHGDKGLCFELMGLADTLLWDLRRVADDYNNTLPSEAVESAFRMVLYKMCRVYSGTYNPDDFVDMIGYAGCAGEVMAKEFTKDVVNAFDPDEGIMPEGGYSFHPTGIKETTEIMADGLVIRDNQSCTVHGVTNCRQVGCDAPPGPLDPPRPPATKMG